MDCAEDLFPGKLHVIANYQPVPRDQSHRCRRMVVRRMKVGSVRKRATPARMTSCGSRSLVRSMTRRNTSCARRRRPFPRLRVWGGTSGALSPRCGRRAASRADEPLRSDRSSPGRRSSAFWHRAHRLRHRSRALAARCRCRRGHLQGARRRGEGSNPSPPSPPPSWGPSSSASSAR